MLEQNKFDVLNVELSGCNLIEASAGTGKTYSIGILVLRMILEKRLQIDQILMVTFTEAAVEELRSRIRLFVREAYDMACHPELLDEGHVAEVVGKALDGNAEDCQTLLKDALAVVDDLAILTIHGFCNRTLGEFAFETQQLFEKEVISDPDELLEFSVNDYWRNNITILPKDELSGLLKYGFSKTAMKDFIVQIMDGKVFKDAVYEGESWIEEYLSYVDTIGAYPQRFIDYYNSDKENIEAEVSAIKGKHAHKYFSPAYGDPELLWNLYLEKVDSAPKYLSSLPETWLDLSEEYLQAEEAAQELLTQVSNAIYIKACDWVVKQIESRKEEKALLTFNDLISKLHTVLEKEVERGESKLIEGLREKYHAVFIDEFQDTDKVQIDIFNKAFRDNNEDGILFFIGDPKQSIYAFRKADLETYKKSREGSKLYTMSTNFRSTPQYVEAMNQFFTYDSDFFADNEISYIEVEAPDSASKMGQIEREGATVSPIEFCAANTSHEAVEYVKDVCLDLLHNHTLNGEKVEPSNIGVLAYSKRLGGEIKQLLNSVGIPAVLIDDAKVIETEEARSMQYILEAIYAPSRSTINKALLTSLFSTTVDEVARLDMMQEQMKFKEAQRTYQHGGVYAAVMKLLDLYNVKGVLLADDRNRAQRILSNIYQMAEICQNKTLENDYDIEKLIAWLIREINNKHESSEGYEMRLESDDDAVKIVTIHKSKGLAYDIVIAPSMQLTSEPFRSASNLTYQDSETFDYVFSNDIQNDEVIQQYSEQKEKENRRLMYVTLTRAKYKSFVVLNTSPRGPKGYMTSLYNSMKAESHPLTQVVTEIDGGLTEYVPNLTVADQNTEEVENISQFKNSWKLLSYSMISRSEHHRYEASAEQDDVYDEFIFKNMPKGAALGTFVHYLLENIDFQDQNTFNYWVEKGEVLYGKKLVAEKNKEFFIQMLWQVVDSVLINAGDGADFRLSDVSVTKRLNELQFYFSIDLFDKNGLEKFGKKVDMDFYSYRGFFQGFIDLVIEHQGVFYILDWKSNYVGDKLEDYSQEALEKAMNGHNYHLQYFIYTIALVRFLMKRMPDFDYDKHFGGAYYVFLRGCRAGKQSGVYYNKPEWEAISQYLKTSEVHNF